jgi:hypothetical protein
VGEELVPADDRAIGQAFRWSLVVLAIGAITALPIWWLITRRPAEEAKSSGPLAAPVAPVAPARSSLPLIPFTDVTREAGIDFVYESGARGDKLLPETMGGGVAVFDYDGDGRQDLFFINGTPWPWDEGAGPTRCALYRNEGPAAADDRAGDERVAANLPVPRFRDVTEETGTGLSLHGMGAAVGDYDGDGRPDLLITAVGGCRLLRNELTPSGAVVFRDVTEEAGVGGSDKDWATAAAFVDLDRDGDLDLWVVRYVKWSREIDFEVDYRLTGIGRAYGPPTNFEGTDSILYRNEGNGRFTEISAEAGIQVRNPATGVPVGKGLALIPTDLDGDGWLDVVVANDKTQNFAFRNLTGEGGGLRFEEIGVKAGLAFDRNGTATGAMGIDAAEFLDDGLLAIAIGNFANEMTSFYVSRGAPPSRLPFSDDAVNEGIGAPSRLSLKFGVLFLDADLDGRLDLLQANGHIEDQISVTQPSQRYAQSAQLFWNRGRDAAGPRRGCYVELPGDRLGALVTPIVGRAAAFADLDDDGDLDLVLTQPAGPPLLLRNDQASGHRWLRVRLKDRGQSPAFSQEAIGATIELLVDGRLQRRVVMPTRSYLAQCELPVTFGLGAATRIDSLAVIWPDGVRTTHQLPEGADVVDRLVEIERPGAAQGLPAGGTRSQ